MVVAAALPATVTPDCATSNHSGRCSRWLKPSTVYDVVQLFVSNVDELRALGPAAIKAVKPDGLLWIAYPKGGATRGATDLPATPWWTKRDVLGEITGETGYKPVAFVKIDEDWTALRFKRA